MTVGESGLVSLHMDNLDVRSALETISRQATMNLLISQGVQGTVTLNLDNVTIEQALDAILKLAGLSSRRDGDLFYVFSPEEIVQEDDRASSSQGSTT